MPTSIEGKVERLENGAALVALDNGRQISLPLDKIGLDLAPGQLMHISVRGGTPAAAEEPAKDFLSEILEP